MKPNKSAISIDTTANKNQLFEMMQQSGDLVTVDVIIAGNEQATICYVDSMIDHKKLEKMLELSRQSKELLRPHQKNETFHTIEEAAEHIILGETVFLFTESGYGIAVDTQGIKFRNVEEPISESTVKGPRSGFNESLQNNIALIRFHFPSVDLKVAYETIGQLSKLSVAILSIGGVANPDLVREVHNRLREIPIDAVLESNYIEEWLTDNHWSLFPLLESTERPDRVIGGLLDGRIAVLIQGSPFVLLLPFVFLQAFQVSEDYAWNFYIASSMRLLRLFCGLIGMLLPAFYVATITYHPELVPTPLLQSIAAAKEPVPFPAVIESFAMMIAFEIMREAGVRMPKQVGQAVSIVGALILGQAAVQAGIVSPIMVIVAALTGICTFTLPPTSINYVIRILQFVMTFLAALLGYVGIMMGLVLLMTYLASLRSFGVPYLAPAAPINLAELTDVIVRRPHILNRKRPSLFGVTNRERYRRKLQK
ncbi:spore germination protein [Paenibacillus yanchengensis]|uniref:Spore germination protein n=1 Tax=Paenibacillus yanchengensis TaxID=2035833 RepID=A0ABW4YQQ4_9BACL